MPQVLKAIMRCQYSRNGLMALILISADVFTTIVTTWLAVEIGLLKVMCSTWKSQGKVSKKDAFYFFENQYKMLAY